MFWVVELLLFYPNLSQLTPILRNDQCISLGRSPLNSNNATTATKIGKNLLLE